MIWTVLVWTFLVGLCHANLLQILPSFKKQFGAPNPLPLFSSLSKEEKVIISKESSKINLFLEWIKEMPYERKFILFLLDQSVTDIEENIDINQQIYFLTASFEIYENYVINHHTILRKLGFFQNATFVPDTHFIQVTFSEKRTKVTPKTHI